MSEKAARTHSHVSNREKHREAGGSKSIYKSVLDNPFRIQWPSVPINVQNSILALVISMLDGVADYQGQCRRKYRKRKREQPSQGRSRKIKGMGEDTGTDIKEPESTVPHSNSLPNANLVPPTLGLMERPAISEHIVVGINEVTKRLELQIRDKRRMTVTNTDTSPEVSQPALEVVLVCRADVDPPLLIDHLPHLVAAYNSIKPGDTIKLVPLPKGAELALAQAVGMRRAAVMGVIAGSPELMKLASLLDSVPSLVATWLVAAVPHRRLVPTHIKQVRTSAPRDMKAAKRRRVEEKTLAKQRRTGRKSE